MISGLEAAGFLLHYARQYEGGAGGADPLSEPWADWIPGVLANHQIRELAKQGFLVELQDPEHAIDASAVDLHLGGEAYETVEGSIKPFGEQYLHQIQQMG